MTGKRAFIPMVKTELETEKFTKGEINAKR
jgi:hypothetical protein